MSLRLLAAAALLALPSLAAADEPAVTVMLSLKQISIDLHGTGGGPEVQAKVRALRDAAAGVTACDQADAVALRIGAQIIANDNVALGALPPPLREQAATMKVGTATRLFGQQGSAVRVLVLCGRHAG